MPPCQPRASGALLFCAKHADRIRGLANTKLCFGNMLIETLTNFFAGDAGIWALCASAFLSATILPGSSEAVLSAAVASAPECSRAVMLVAAASACNTLGSMTSWCIGRFIPDRLPDAPAVERVRRWGAAALFFAWVPIVGDMLPLAAGWLKIKFWQALFWTAAGKTVRYSAVAVTVVHLF